MLLFFLSLIFGGQPPTYKFSSHIAGFESPDFCVVELLSAPNELPPFKGEQYDPLNSPFDFGDCCVALLPNNPGLAENIKGFQTQHGDGTPNGGMLRYWYTGTRKNETGVEEHHFSLLHPDDLATYSGTQQSCAKCQRPQNAQKFPALLLPDPASTEGISRASKILVPPSNGQFTPASLLASVYNLPCTSELINQIAKRATLAHAQLSFPKTSELGGKLSEIMRALARLTEDPKSYISRRVRGVYFELMLKTDRESVALESLLERLQGELAHEKDATSSLCFDIEMYLGCLDCARREEVKSSQKNPPPNSCLCVVQ